VTPAELVFARKSLADVHDRARASFTHAHPEFGRVVRDVATGLERIAAQMMRTRDVAPIEIGRSYMWLGDALFDLAQGRHAPFGPAIDAYRAADPYVRIGHDDLLSAKYDANFAYVLMRADPSPSVLAEVIERYRRSLPMLRAHEPAYAASIDRELARATQLSSMFGQLETEIRARRADTLSLLASMRVGALDSQQLAAITALLEELAAVEASGDLARTLRVFERTREIFQQLMRLAEPKTEGPRARISAIAMKLWAELTAVALTAQIDAGSRDRAFAIQRALLLAKFAILNEGEAAAVDAFAQRLLPAASEARSLLTRNHLTWLTPLWPVAASPAIAHGLYGTTDEIRREIADIARQHGLEILVDAPGRELAEARFDSIRRSAVMVADVRDEALLAPACYEIGIALTLGKPIVVVALPESRLPFDIDIRPVAYRGDAASRDALATAIEEALILPQRPPDARSLEALVEAAKLAFASQPANVDELARSIGAPLDASGMLENIVRAAAASGRHHLVARPAWSRDYDPPGARRLFHVMPFRPDWASAISDRTEGVCRQSGVAYRRGDGAEDRRIIRAIWDDLCLASHVLVDLTGMNANVCLELGIADTLGKTTLVVGQANTAARLFPMLAKSRVLGYDLAATAYEELVRDFVQ
jgi:hypothetical protein